MSTGITAKQHPFLKLPLMLPNSRLEKLIGDPPHDKLTCQVASSNLSFAAIA